MLGSVTPTHCLRDTIKGDCANNGVNIASLRKSTAQLFIHSLTSCQVHTSSLLHTGIIDTIYQQGRTRQAS